MEAVDKKPTPTLTNHSNARAMPAMLYGFVLNYEICKMYYQTHQVHIQYRNESDIQEGLASPEQFEGICGSIVGNMAHDIEVNHEGLGPDHYRPLVTKLARVPRKRYTTVVVLTLVILRTKPGQPITKEMCAAKATEVPRELIDFIKQRVGLTQEPAWHHADNATNPEYFDLASSSEEEEEDVSLSDRLVPCIIARSLVYTLMKPLE